MRVAVVGLGIFGATAAAALARDGHVVTAYDRHADILRGASGVNQLRLHRGYHYPRSPETTRSVLEAEPSFSSHFGAAIIDDLRHLYAVATESRTPLPAYLAMCERHGLAAEEIDPADLFAPGTVAACLAVDEPSLDVDVLRAICWRGLVDHGVDVRLGCEATPQDLKAHDHTVLACYGENSGIAGALDAPSPIRHHKVCEVVVVRLPDALRDTSIVVVDGRYPSFDPLGRTGLHLLGHVDAMHHHANIGVQPEVPDHIRPSLDGAWHPPPPWTRFTDVVAATAEFVPAVGQARHVASMFALRSVAPDVTSTDERPTVVSTKGTTTTVFSGKLGACVMAADEVATQVGGRAGGRARPSVGASQVVGR